MPPSPQQPDHRVTAADRLIARTRSIATLLAHRLESAMSFHDLTTKRLWAAHRNTAELHRQGRAPTATDFWDLTAQPEAQHLLNEAVQVIDAHQSEFTKALQQFAVSIREQQQRRRTANPAVDNASRPVSSTDRAVGSAEPLLAVDPLLAADLAVAREAVECFIAGATVSHRINEVGAWWQSKLRRRAILATVGRLLFTPLGRYELAVTAAEMTLLSEPPWSHDDRMLSAFELAHGDLRDHVSDLAEELDRRAAAMIRDVHTIDRRRRSPRPQPRPTGTSPHRGAETIELG